MELPTVIAFTIHCHSRLDRVRRLIGWLYDPAALFIVTYDATSRQTLDHDQLKGLPDNVVVVPSLPTLWGGISLVHATLAAMRLALEKGAGWSHLINISGTDLPLATYARMVEVLNNEASRGVSNFVADFGAPEIAWPVSADASLSEPPSVMMRPDVTLESFGAARSLFADIYDSPVVHPRLRPALVVAQDMARKHLLIYPPNADERRARQAFFAEYPFRFGRCWIVAGRRFCEFLCASPVAARILEGLHTAFIPDESIFQMAIRAADPARVGQTSPNNLRLAQGDPLDVRDSMLTELQASGAFFARKLDFGASRLIDEWADTRALAHASFARHVS